LYAGRPIEAADGESRPVPCRWVSFAARFADEIAREAALRRPTLVMSDSFAFVGRVVAGMLGLAHVDLRSGHDVDPARFVESIEAERVRISPRCHEAVAVLRDRYGWEDASPFSYGTHKSDVLNICSEPEAFVSATTRRALEPIAYFGSLPSLTEIERLQRPATPAWFGPTRNELQVFVSFGTVAWWYYQAQALTSLGAIAEAIEARPGARAVISLGNAPVTAAQAGMLVGPSVTVEPYVDQWQLLGEADIFVTHHGLNSTHEAIFNLIPMISHPFFGDQPAMAATCQRLDIAVPLVEAAGHAVEPRGVDAAIETWVAARPRMDAALAHARDLELDVMARRQEVVDRIIGLAGPTPGA